MDQKGVPKDVFTGGGSSKRDVLGQTRIAAGLSTVFCLVLNTRFWGVRGFGTFLRPLLVVSVGIRGILCQKGDQKEVKKSSFGVFLSPFWSGFEAPAQVWAKSESKRRSLERGPEGPGQGLSKKGTKNGPKVVPKDDLGGPKTRFGVFFTKMTSF